MSLTRQVWDKFKPVLAAGPATFSKHPSRYAATVPPLLAHTGAAGCRVSDLDGNRYIDTVAALGAMILGYDDPAVQHAVERVNPCMSMGTLLEGEVAELITHTVPGADKVRFATNGSDVTNHAIRLAREQTKKWHVICCGYHGFADWYIASTNANGGILPAVSRFTHQVTWGDVQAVGSILTRFPDDIAAIIVEVPPVKWGDDPENVATVLAVYQELASRCEAVFILDEVVTGFRYSLSGAQGLYGVIPDLTCLGKALANGWPLAALAGREDLMEMVDNYAIFMSSTYAAFPPALAAAQATLTTLRETDALDHLQAVGTRLGDGLTELFSHYKLPVEVIGNHARMVVKWENDLDVTGPELKTLWMQETARHGVIFGGPTFPMTCWTDTDVQDVLNAAEKACDTIREHLGQGTVKRALLSEPAEDVFAERYREAT